MNSLLRHLSRLGLSVFLLSAAIAQTAPSSAVPPAARDGNPAEESPIELSPFVVTADKDVGYVAANTLSGSRLNTPLYDTAASISEMTKEFLDDIGARDTMDAVEYALGFEADRPGTNDNLSQFQSQTVVSRGLGRSGTVSRDFFSWNLSSDTFSTERLSLSRGPNSVLYGVGNAGGIINTMSKRALFATKTQLNLRVDENDSRRFHIDYNQRLGDKAALRVNLLDENQKTWRELEYTKSKRAHLAGTWRPFSRTEIRADYERGIQDRLIGLRFSGRDYFLMWVDAGMPAYDRTINGNTYPTGTISWGAVPRLTYDGDADQWFNYQRFARTRGRGARTGGGLKFADETYMPFTALLGGPASTTDNDCWTGSLYVQQQVVKNLYVELAANKQSSRRTIFRGLDHDRVGLQMDANMTLPGGVANPHYGELFVEGQALENYSRSDTLNQRASVTYEWDSKSKWLGRHRWLALATREDSDGEGKQLNEANLTPLNPAVPSIANAQNAINRRTYLNFQGGNRSYNQDPFRNQQEPFAFTDPATGLTGTITPGFYISNNSPSKDVNEGALIAGQSNFLNDRAILTYGFRRDKATRQSATLDRDPVTQVVTGVIWKPSETYSGNTRTAGTVLHLTKWLSVYGNKSDNFTPQGGLDVNGDTVGNVRGEGTDYGVKFRLLDNKIYARVGVYKTSQIGVAAAPFNYMVQIQRIWEAIEGSTGPHTSKFTGSPINNTDTRNAEVEGFEAEVTANPFKGMAVTLNYATLKRILSNINPITRAHYAANRALWEANGDLPVTGGTITSAMATLDALFAQDDLQEGREATGPYPKSFNVFGRYQFQSDALKRWSVGAGGRFRVGRVLGYLPDGSPVRSAKWFLADANLAYRRPLWNRKVDLRVQLNVQNIFDNRDLIWTAINATTFQKEDYSLFTPRTFILSASFSH